MTAETQFRLRLLEQAVVQPARFFGQLRHREEIGLGNAQTNALGSSRRLHQVTGMTVHAGDSVLRVGRMVKGGLIPAALMAQQTTLRVLLGIPVEGEDEFSGGRGLRIVPARGFLAIGVRLSWTVAHLAAGDRSSLRWRKGCVPGLSVFLKLGSVAGPAAVRSGVDTVGQRDHRRDRNGGRLTRLRPGLSEAVHTEERK